MDNKIINEIIDKVYDNYAVGGLLPNSEIVNGMFNDPVEINLNKISDFELNNKIDLQDVVNKIENILKDVNNPY